MFDAQQLLGDGQNTIRVYSPWFSRGADNFRVTLDVMFIEEATLVLEVFQKNQEDVGDGTLFSGVSITASGTGRTTQEWTGLKELVRYRYSLQVNSIGAKQKVLFRVLSPEWFDSVKA